MNLNIASLKESTDFLNCLYDHVTSAIFIADENAEIYSFNDSFKTLFFKKEDEILHHLCGNVIGCIYHVDEDKDCGSTSNCSNCKLRENVIRSFTEKVPVFKEKLIRDFVIKGVKVRKHFIFSTRYVRYSNQDLVLVIVDDISEMEEYRKKIEMTNLKLEMENRYLNELIEEQMAKIVDFAARLAREKENKLALIQEIQHRVNNNLQVISSLLNIQASYSDDPRIHQLLKEVQLRVRVLKVLFKEIYNGDFHQFLEMNKIFPLIFEESRTNNNDSLSKCRIECLVETGGILFEQAIILGLLTAEIFYLLITELPHDQENKIILSLKNDDSRRVLSIKTSVPCADVFNTRENPTAVNFIRILEKQLNGNSSVTEEDFLNYTFIF